MRSASSNRTPEALLVLDRATIFRAAGEVMFHDLTWAVYERETWAVVGPVGSGKTALAEVILGAHHLRAGSIAWPLLDRLRARGRRIGWPSDVIASVAFKEESWLFSYHRHYYQQRFNFIEPQDDLTLADYLRSGSSPSDEDLHELARQLGIETLLPLSFIKLSNGQVRRARVVRALLLRPEWLILDEPFMGLDVTGRHELADLLGNLVRRGTRVLLITRPDAIPEWVTHVLELDRLSSHRQGPRSEFVPPVQDGRDPPAALPHPAATAEPVIEMRNVNVAYGERTVLRDVSWTVRAGERWAILGPNGSGKSTLLSLICADNPQAYRNDIRLFGRQRGSGESIWEIKQRIGLVSPELHLYFSEPLNALEAAATGFFDVLACRPTTRAQDATVHELFDHFGLASLAARPFARLSTGEQRLVLLIRALVKKPPLLILDEPFQALDAETIARALDWLGGRLGPDQTLLFVTHHADEIPPSVTRRLQLREGKVVETGAGTQR